jgi:hypothetical protein
MLDVRTRELLAELATLLPTLRQVCAPADLRADALADVAALISTLYVRVIAIERRTGASEPMPQGDIAARLERLERHALQSERAALAAINGNAPAAQPAVSELVRRIEALEQASVRSTDVGTEGQRAELAAIAARLEALEAAATAGGNASEAGNEQREPGADLAAIVARVEALEAAARARRTRELALRARNDERSADALKRRKAIERLMDTLQPPHGWPYPTATHVHEALLKAARPGEQPPALRTVRWHMAAVAAERANNQRGSAE